MVHVALSGVFSSKIHSTFRAFAAVLRDGTVVTKGGQNNSGDSINVQAALRGVDKFYSTESAFAAVLSIGTVVTWVDHNYGRDSNNVQVA